MTQQLPKIEDEITTLVHDAMSNFIIETQQNVGRDITDEEFGMLVRMFLNQLENEVLLRLIEE